MFAISLVGSLFLSGTLSGDLLNFTTTLDESQAAVCVGTGSAGIGTGTFTLDTDTGIVNYNVTLSGLTGTETFCHVHGPALECAMANQVYSLPLGNTKIGTTTLDAAEQADMIDGLHYVNVHTTTVAGGEIRGQVLLFVPPEPVPTLSEWSITILTLLLL